MQGRRMFATYVFGNVHYNMQHVVDELGKLSDIEFSAQASGKDDLVIRLNNHNSNRVHSVVKWIRGIQGLNVTDVHERIFATDWLTHSVA